MQERASYRRAIDDKSRKTIDNRTVICGSARLAGVRCRWSFSPTLYRPQNATGQFNLLLHSDLGQIPLGVMSGFNPIDTSWRDALAFGRDTRVIPRTPPFGRKRHLAKPDAACDRVAWPDHPSGRAVHGCGELLGSDRRVVGAYRCTPSAPRQ
jgi:hypothetical protein